MSRHLWATYTGCNPDFCLKTAAHRAPPSVRPMPLSENSHRFCSIHSYGVLRKWDGSCWPFARVRFTGIDHGGWRTIHIKLKCRYLTARPSVSLLAHTWHVNMIATFIPRLIRKGSSGWKSVSERRLTCTWFRYRSWFNVAVHVPTFRKAKDGCSH